MENKSLEHPDAEQQRRRRGQKRGSSQLVSRILRNRRTFLVTLWLALKIWEGNQGYLRRLLGVRFFESEKRFPLAERVSVSMKPLLNRALKLVRVYHNLTQSEVARRTGLSKSYVSEIESARKKVSIEILNKYSEAFDIPTSSLMLFAEHSEDKRFSEDVRVYVANKTLRMLDWIATITEAEGGESERST